ncbi:MAG: hypothetical protein R2873_00225 [Caldilineaceae bacterium]
MGGIPTVVGNGGALFEPFFFAETDGGAVALFHASALMFVAYTGYGRIATLGEEVA